MKIDAFVKECVGLSFLVYYSSIFVVEVRFRNISAEDYAEVRVLRFRVGAPPT